MDALPGYDSWRLDNPYDNEPDDPEPAYAIGGDILDRELVGDRWLYLVVDADSGVRAWLGEGEVADG